MSKKQVIVMRTDLNMRKGKMVSQGAHASLKAILDQGKVIEVLGNTLDVFAIPLTEHLHEWITTNFKKITVQAPDEQTLHDVIQKAKEAEIPYALILDSGLTEFGGVATYTCCAIGPADDEIINSITGDFKLL
jgi:PTH2 family peptidyl-tRNA hydrolase